MERFYINMYDKNIIRCIDNPYQYIVHLNYLSEWNRTPLKCSMPRGKCILCERGDRPTYKWLIPILDRADNSTYKIWDITFLYFKELKEISKRRDKPTTFDLVIIFDQNKIEIVDGFDSLLNESEKEEINKKTLL